jgi:tyrosyl-tRNA synthetase
MFNMLAGRKLVKEMQGREKFVMTTPLLTDSEGRKIGKTEGNVIGLTDKPADLFGKMMSLPDDIITKGLEYLTDVPMEEIKEIEDKLQNGEHPVPFKKRLAYEVVKQLNDENAAEGAQKEFENVVQGEGMPTEIPQREVKQDLFILSDLLVELGLASSKSEAKRLVEQGGVEIDNEKQDNPSKEIAIEDTIVIKVGKRKFVEVTKA